MIKKINLREQALAEKRRIELSGKTIINTKMNMSRILEILLPLYDQKVKPRLWHAAHQRHKGIKGGVRSGKTFTLEANAIGLSFLNRPLFHLSMSPSFDLAVLTVVQVLEQFCKDNHLEYDWTKATQLFRIIHGNSKNDIANILVFGADQGFKGVTAASGDINEPFSISKEKFTLWWERISDHRAVRLERDWGGTAEPEKMNWGHEYFKQEKFNTKDFYADTFTTYENEKYLPKGYIPELESKYDEKRRQVYMLGKNLNLASGPVYHSFDVQKHTVKSDFCDALIRNAKQMRVVISFDFNVDPITAAEIIIWNDIRIQYDEYVIHSSSTDEICDIIINRIRERYKHLQLSLTITGDATGVRKTSNSKGMSDHRIIADKFILGKMPATFYFEDSNPEQKDRVNYVNKLIESGRHLINESCTETIKDRELVTWKRGSEKFVINKSDPERTHSSDAADYGLLLTKRMGLDNSKPDEDEEGYRSAGAGIILGDQRRFK